MYGSQVCPQLVYKSSVPESRHHSPADANRHRDAEDAADDPVHREYRRETLPAARVLQHVEIVRISGRHHRRGPDVTVHVKLGVRFA